MSKSAILIQGLTSPAQLRSIAKRVTNVASTEYHGEVYAGVIHLSQDLKDPDEKCRELERSYANEDLVFGTLPSTCHVQTRDIPSSVSELHVELKLESVLDDDCFEGVDDDGKVRREKDDVFVEFSDPSHATELVGKGKVPIKGDTRASFRLHWPKLPITKVVKPKPSVPAKPAKSTAPIVTPKPKPRLSTVRTGTSAKSEVRKPRDMPPEPPFPDPFDSFESLETRSDLGSGRSSDEPSPRVPKKEDVVFDSVPVTNRAKLRLLQLHPLDRMLHENGVRCEVEVCLDEGKVILKGTEDQVEKGCEGIWSIIRRRVEEESEFLGKEFRSYRELSAFSQLVTKLADTLEVGVELSECDEEEGGCEVTVYSFKDQDDMLEQVLDTLKKEWTTETVEIPKEANQLLRRGESELDAVIQRCTNEHGGSVSVGREGGAILVRGRRSPVKDVAGKVRALVSAHSVSEDRLSLLEPQVAYLRAFPGKLSQDTQNVIKDVGRRDVRLQGHVAKVKAAKAEVKAFVMGIHENELKIELKGMLKFAEAKKKNIEAIATKEECLVELRGKKRSQDVTMRDKRRSEPPAPTPRSRPAPSRGPSGRARPASFLGMTTSHKTSVDTQTRVVQGVTIELRQGDITKDKSDVIVTTIHPTLDLSKSGIVANKIRRQTKDNGNLIQAELTGAGRLKPGDIAVTSGGGLRCSNIYFMNLPRKTKSDEQEEEETEGVTLLAQGVATCLSRAEDEGCSSIAIPTIGCGKLGYDTDEVAGVLVTEAENFAQNHPRPSLKKISLVVYGGKDFQCFDNALKGKLGDDGASRDNTTSGTRGDDDGAGQLWGVAEEEEEEESYDQMPVAPEVDDVSTRVGDASYPVYQVTGKDNNFQKLAAAVKKLFQDSHATKDIRLFHTDAEDVRDILEAAADKGVYVEDKEAVLTVWGEKELVTQLRTDILEASHIAANAKDLEKDYAYQKKEGSRRDVLKALTFVDDTPTPQYWSDQAKHKKLTKWAETMSVKSKPFLRAPLARASALYREIEALVQSMWDKSKVAVGYDATGLDAIYSSKRIEVTKVEAIENSGLLQMYNVKRKALIESHLNGKVFTPFDQAVQDMKEDVGVHAGPIMTSQHVGPELRDMLVSEVNEVFLFHGTQPVVMDSICTQGLDGRVNERGMLGRGAYLCDSSTKADQYADSPAARSGGEKHMILARALLGHMYLTQDKKPYTRPPCSVCREEKCVQHPNKMCDSIVFVPEPKKFFREFIVYGNDECSCDFVVTYVRK